MAEDKGLVSDFCSSGNIDVHFSNALGNYTPCFLDSILLMLCHLIGTLFFIAHWYRMKASPRSLHYLRGRALILQWMAFLSSIICFAIPILELGARLGDSQILLSPAASLAPFEYVGYSTAIIFWFVSFMVLYRERTRFLWTGLWTVRFSLALVCAGQLAKFSFVVQNEHVDKDAYYALYMIYVASHILLAIFSVFQIPSGRNLVLRESQDYEALDDEESEETRVLCEGEICPERHVGIFSTLVFSWMSPFLRQGYKRPLEFEDIWCLDLPDHSSQLSSNFQKHWKTELEFGQGRGSKRWDNPSLFRALRKTIGPLIIQAIPLKLIVDISQFTGPVFLDLLLTSVQDEEPSWRGYTYAFSMFVGLVIGTLADNQHFQRVMRAGFQLRSIITTEVQKKSLFLTPTERARFSAGQIFNFVASDSEALQLVCNNLLTIMSSPLRMIGAMILLFFQLGSASLVALVSLIIMVPVQMSVVQWSAHYVKKALQQTDDRAKLEREVISGIEAVKCNAWEVPFWSRILDIRKLELGILWKSFVLGAVNTFIVTSVPAVVAISTFAVYVSLGNELTASKAFVSLTLFDVLRFPLFQLPQVITQVTQAGVSLRRLESFLKAQEQGRNPPSESVPPGDPAVVIKGDFAWSSNSQAVLKELDLEFPAGSLTIIVGMTGCGKSTLISSILGLTQGLSGRTVVLHGTTSLVPQSPFIVNASVKENILFGHDFEETRYLASIAAASLGPDLESLPGGDQTELGEGGTNISGGQKQRIALARAVYANADVCLLDDPLSALDTRVGRSVFNNCILGAMKEKTVILVTNQLQYVKHANTVLFLNHGRVIEKGSYAELMGKRNGAFAQMMNESQAEEEDLENEENRIIETKTVSQISGERSKNREEAGAQLTQKEHRSIGVVSWNVIQSYVAAMSGYTAFGILIFEFLLAEVIRVGSTIWLTYWTNQGEDSSHGQMFYMWIYGGILITQVIVVFINQLDFKRLGKVAAEVLHEKMMFKLLRAPMAFYHTTPVGRIINRLTKDTADIDKNLVEYIAFFLRSALQLFSTLILVAVITPLTLPVLACILILFYFLYAYFQTTVREIKRLDAISRSPVYSSINDVLNGISTVRAFGAEGRLLERHMRLVDDNIIMALLNQSTNRWLSIRLETLGALAALAAGVLTVEQGRSSSYMGLTLSYALSITTYTSITIRLASLAENVFNAVERVAEYSQLEEEAPVEVEDSVDDDWPDKGGVKFDNIKMSYRPGLPLVLKGVSASIEPRQRVGVVGRTGAGKSSLMNALFRIAELSEGRVEIDGVNIRGIGLRQLRSKIAIIPQKPIIFAGSIRSNLDPFEDHSDEAIWTSLTRAHLDQVVSASGEGLEMSLQEGGAPLSEGQRQLLSLARAVLRPTRILILDEATANVDVDTDALIQETIKQEFSDRTVIAIAHRLHTIIDGDKVLVLDKGTLAEFDSPAELLRNPQGIFTSMVKETGEATERFLKSVAFGEVDLREARAGDAAKGLERVRSVRKSTETWSTNLLQNAEKALFYLSNVREQLTECRRREQLRNPDEDQDEDFEFGRDALKLMKAIEGVVKDAKVLLGEQGNIFSKAALLGSDMMESLEMSADRQWSVPPASRPIEITPSPNTRRGVRRSLSVRQPQSSI